MDDLDVIVVLSFFGFLAVAFMLLAPVYFFLKREEASSRYWTEDELARRLHEASDVAPAEDAEQPDTVERS